jgi:putative glutamine amidotransferase
MRPLIGVFAHAPRTLEFFAAQTCPETYLLALENAGADPVILPVYDSDETLRRYVQMCDGFLLPGGIDVNPLTYGEDPHPMLQGNRLDFDECELHLIRLILETKKPLLGICRGCQILNVAFGGTLYQDIVSMHEGAQLHSQTELTPGASSHRIRIEPGSVLEELYGSEMRVNSFHHQAVKELGKGLKATAHAYDGIIEAYEAVDYPFVLGVQWHPEQETNADRAAILPIFKRFVEAC